MKIKKDILLETLKSKCNTNNFNSISSRINVGFTQKHNQKNYYVSVIDLEDGVIKVNVWEYGTPDFNFESDVYISHKKYLWKLQKTLMKAGIFLTLGEIKRFICTK